MQGGETYELDEAIFMIGQLYYRERTKDAEIRRLTKLNEELASDNQQMAWKLDAKSEEGGDEQPDPLRN